MDYEQAIQERVSTGVAIQEIRQHGCDAVAIEYGEGLYGLFEKETKDYICRIVDGEVSGADVLGWLGY